MKEGRVKRLTAALLAVFLVTSLLTTFASAKLSCTVGEKCTVSTLSKRSRAWWDVFGAPKVTVTNIDSKDVRVYVCDTQQRPLNNSYAQGVWLKQGKSMKISLRWDSTYYIYAYGGIWSGSSGKIKVEATKYISSMYGR